MLRIAYVNGRYQPYDRAVVHIEDRGYQFADGVYEVVTIWDGHPIDEAGHIDRLGRSLEMIRLGWPVARPALHHIIRRVVRLNRLRRGLVYIQVTRGVAPRAHPFPAAARPALVVTARRIKAQPEAWLRDGVSVILVPDERWARCDIKSTSLLANVLARQAAKEAGCYESWQVDDRGMITEGALSNAWIVADGRIRTHETGRHILAGITRDRVIRLAESLGVPVEERAFTPAEAQGADEAFLTGASAFVLPVTRIGDRPVADGRPGPITLRLRQAYCDFVAAGGRDG